MCVYLYLLSLRVFMCKRVCACVHVYMFKCIYECICVYVYAFAFKCSRMCVCVYMRERVCMCICVDAHSCTFIFYLFFYYYSHSKLCWTKYNGAQHNHGRFLLKKRSLKLDILRWLRKKQTLKGNLTFSNIVYQNLVTAQNFKYLFCAKIYYNIMKIIWISGWIEMNKNYVTWKQR